MENKNPELVIVGHGNAVTALAFSADGKTLVSASYDKTAIVWDVETGTMRRLLKLKDAVDDVAITPDGSIVVTDGEVWDAYTGKRVRSSRRNIGPFAFSPNGRILACASFDHNINTFFVIISDIHTWRTRHRFACGENQPQSFAFSSDGIFVAALGYDFQEEISYFTLVCNLKTGETHRFPGGESAALFSGNLDFNTHLDAASSDGTQLWNAKTANILKSVAEHNATFADFSREVILSQNGRLLAVGRESGSVSVWDVETGNQLWQKAAHRGWLRAMAFSYDGATLVTAGDDHAIRLWNSVTGESGHTLGRQKISVEAVAFSPDGQAFTAISDNGTACLWSISPPYCERQEVNAPGVLALGAPCKPDTARNLWNFDATALPTDTELPTGFSVVAISPDGTLIALKLNGYISIWNRIKRTLQHTMQNAHVSWVTSTFSPDNRHLATGSDDGLQVCLFDTNTGAVATVIVTEDQTIRFAFSPDGYLLAMGHLGGSVTLWNVRTGKRKRVLWAPADSISALAFAPDGETLAVGTAYEETVWVKSLTRGRKDIGLVGHTDDIRSIDFSPDGTRIATGAQDGTVRLWESESGKLLATFLALPGEEWIVYTPEGDYTGSPGAEKWILWRDGDDLVPVTRNQQSK